MHARFINPGFHSFRTVIQLSSDTYMIIDRTTTPAQQETHFNIPGINLQFADNGEIISTWDDSSLRITPLYPLNIPVSTAVIAAAKRENVDFTTTRVTFDIDSAPISAYIISACGKDGIFPKIVIDIDNIDVEVDNKNMKIKLSLNDVAINYNSDIQQVIPLLTVPEIC